MGDSATTAPAPHALFFSRMIARSRSGFGAAGGQRASQRASALSRQYGANDALFVPPASTNLAKLRETLDSLRRTLESGDADDPTDADENARRRAALVSNRVNAFRYVAGPGKPIG